MSLFAMADLHLSHSVNKPMDIFGSRWTDYMNKIKKKRYEEIYHLYSKFYRSGFIANRLLR